MANTQPNQTPNLEEKAEKTESSKDDKNNGSNRSLTSSVLPKKQSKYYYDSNRNYALCASNKDNYDGMELLTADAAHLLRYAYFDKSNEYKRCDSKNKHAVWLTAKEAKKRRAKNRRETKKHKKSPDQLKQNANHKHSNSKNNGEVLTSSVLPKKQPEYFHDPNNNYALCASNRDNYDGMVLLSKSQASKLRQFHYDSNRNYERCDPNKGDINSDNRDHIVLLSVYEASQLRSGFYDKKNGYKRCDSKNENKVWLTTREAKNRRDACRRKTKKFKKKSDQSKQNADHIAVLENDPTLKKEIKKEKKINKKKQKVKLEKNTVHQAIKQENKVKELKIPQKKKGKIIKEEKDSNNNNDTRRLASLNLTLPIKRPFGKLQWPMFNRYPNQAKKRKTSRNPLSSQPLLNEPVSSQSLNGGPSTQPNDPLYPVQSPLQAILADIFKMSTLFSLPPQNNQAQQKNANFNPIQPDADADEPMLSEEMMLFEMNN